MLACMSVCVGQVIAVDKTKNTMRVGAGMRYTEFLKEAQKAGMSVQVCVCVVQRAAWFCGLAAPQSRVYTAGSRAQLLSCRGVLHCVCVGDQC